MFCHNFADSLLIIYHSIWERRYTTATNITSVSHLNVCQVFSNLDIYSDIIEWHGQYQCTDSDTDNYRLVWLQTHVVYAINTITSILKVSTYIITEVLACNCNTGAFWVLICFHNQMWPFIGHDKIPYWSFELTFDVLLL